MGWSGKTATVVKLPDSFAILFASAADFNTQFPQENSEHPVDHTMLVVLGLSETISAMVDKAGLQKPE